MAIISLACCVAAGARAKHRVAGGEALGPGRRRHAGDMPEMKLLIREAREILMPASTENSSYVHRQYHRM